MSVEWQIRPFEQAVSARDVTNPHPRANSADVGDTVVLYRKDDDSHHDIRMRVTAVHADGRMAGTIAAGNRWGSRGDEQLEIGATVDFESRHVIRIEKAT